MAQHVARTEGLLALFTLGLAPSMLRELTYSSVRMGLYEPVRNRLEPNTKVTTLGTKIVAGLFSGALGSAFVNPTDVVKVRMQAHSTSNGTPVLYRNVYDAFVTIARTEGIRRGLYMGTAPTVVRAACLTSGQLASYDQSKHWLLKTGILNEGYPLHLTSSIISSLVACTVANPMDVVKTRMMNDRARQYNGMMDCITKTLRNEGPAAFLKGWLPSYLRLGPHFLLSLPLFEQLRHLFGLQPL
eukprot:TRINITY_DN3906_c0_g1_i2.p1 TRINITY_DN3906_c0_g1~~TRINITY_DN3906_c0_g1_i2.p1  ORF type:complete len:243 (+),score=30.75 TRINITY_DN3906_c0_g1_i2:292-1020(+)